MKLKNNKGITLVALIITIIVMLIIAGIVVYNGVGIIKQANVEDVRTNMLLVEAQIKNYVEQAKFEKKETINGVTVDNLELKINKVEGKKNKAREDLYKIDPSIMSDLGLGKLKDETDNYLISFKIDEVSVGVYYVPGITDADGNTYHELSEMEE